MNSERTQQSPEIDKTPESRKSKQTEYPEKKGDPLIV